MVGMAALVGQNPRGGRNCGSTTQGPLCAANEQCGPHSVAIAIFFLLFGHRGRLGPNMACTLQYYTKCMQSDEAADRAEGGDGLLGRLFGGWSGWLAGGRSVGGMKVALYWSHRSVSSLSLLLSHGILLPVVAPAFVLITCSPDCLFRVGGDPSTWHTQCSRLVHLPIDARVAPADWKHSKSDRTACCAVLVIKRNNSKLGRGLNGKALMHVYKLNSSQMNCKACLSGNAWW
jgi:hypothetical protein